ncbi:MAG: SURF1 family protein [Gammaproteobacteria bacterium]|nr:SURF1 family protein [Gammaproteobacteria bacterium]
MMLRPRWTFRPRVVTTTAAVAFCVLSVLLGNWQLRRAVEKENEQALRRGPRGQAPVTMPATPGRHGVGVAIRRRGGAVCRRARHSDRQPDARGTAGL